MTVSPTARLPLHASGYADPGYYTNPGRPHSCKLNYGWQLADVNPGDGGFALIPGKLPEHYSSLPSLAQLQG